MGLLRNHPLVIQHQLAAGGTRNLAITPSAAQQTLTWDLLGLPARVLGMFGYALAIRLTARGAVTAGAEPIYADEMIKFLFAAVEVRSPRLGQLYARRFSNGPTVDRIFSFVGCGYTEPQRFPRTIQGAAVAAPFERDLLIPLGYGPAKKPHHFAPCAGLLEGGQVDFTVPDTTTLPVGASFVGAVTYSAELVVVAQPEAQLHVPHQWKQYEVPSASAKQLLLKDLGGLAGLDGIDAGAGLTYLGLLADDSMVAAGSGVGLGGALSPANLTSVDDIPFLGQRNIDLPRWLVEAEQMRSGIAYKGASESAGGADDFVGYPYRMRPTTPATGETPYTNTGRISARALVVPFLSPGQDFESSKAIPVTKSEQLVLSISAVSAGQHLFVSHEMHEFRETKIAEIRRWWTDEMGVPANWEWSTKLINKQDPLEVHPGKLRWVPMVLRDPSGGGA